MNLNNKRIYQDFSDSTSSYKVDGSVICLDSGSISNLYGTISVGGQTKCNLNYSENSDGTIVKQINNVLPADSSTMLTYIDEIISNVKTKLSNDSK